MKRCGFLICIMTVAVVASACQPTPEDLAVKQKDGEALMEAIEGSEVEQEEIAPYEADNTWTETIEGATGQFKCIIDASVSRPSSQTGIPYCWGGFDGLSTSSSSSWTNYSGAMSYGAFAGNDLCTGYRKSGTAGLDCSGYVSAAAGFASKLNTTNLASSTYTTLIDESVRIIYDIYVDSGHHVLFFIMDYNNQIYTREATTKGEEKAKSYTRSYSYISSFDLRRFNGW